MTNTMYCFSLRVQQLTREHDSQDKQSPVHDVITTESNSSNTWTRSPPVFNNKSNVY